MTAIPAQSSAPRSRPPLSYAQERLWFLEQLTRGTSQLIIPLTLRLRGPLDTDRLTGALNTVLSRHDALRMRFPPAENGLPRVIVEDSASLAWQEANAVDAHAATILIDDFLAAPFDVAAGPLLRAMLVRLAADDHVLAIAVHHMAADRWSGDVLIREVFACYDGAQPASPQVRYAEYAAWQRTRPRPEADLEYWRRQLTGLAPLDLPIGRPRPAQQAYRGAAHAFRLDPGTTGQLARLSHERGGTVSMTLLAAFAAVLGRYAGSDDVAIGSPVAGRCAPGLDGAVGCFANMLTIRADLSGDPAFEDLMSRVREVALGAYAHQELPFEQLVTELGLPRDMSRPPLFSVIFAMQDAAGHQHPPAGLSVEAFPAVRWTARVDLELRAAEEAEGLSCIIIYNTDLFPPEVIERLAGHLQALTRQVAARPGIRLSDVDLLTDDDRRLVVRDWNDTEVPGHGAATLHAPIEAAAASRPGAVAVTFEGRHVRYAELNTAANRVAHTMRGLGVGPGTSVAICAERSPELVAGLLGVLKAGGAYLPVDPGYPPDRVAFMLADAAAPVLLTQRSLRATLPTSARVLMLDDPATWANAAVTDPEPVTGPDDTAYLIYTSGSTGRPKGVLNTHRGIANRLDWMQRRYPIDAGDAVLQKTPVSFDVSVWELFWPLRNGARLVLATPGGHKDAAYLRELIDAEGVTTVHFVPSMLALFLGELAAGGPLTHCGSLRRVLCSGEELPTDLARRCVRLLPRAELHNLYGPTEAAVDVSAWYCRPDALAGLSRVPIGGPIANTALYVLDAGLHPVPVGLPGELYIGGAGVARGYLNRPALTAERFVPNPFGPAGSRLYRTGDLARWRPEGVLEFLGRTDTQVKLRGMRIEPAEVEAALRAQPGVSDAVVIVREDRPGDQRLVGYVTPADAAATPLVLKASLPDYMVPSALVPLDALPLTPNGKLDRGALPAPAAGRDPGPGFGAPTSAAERLVAGIWAELLGTSEIGAGDNFFDLGGHSLLAIQMVASLRGRPGTRPVSVTDVFRYPTVRELAALAGPSAAGREPQARPDEPARPGALDASGTHHADAERALASIWSQVLSVAQVGADDNFFELGGHSLTAQRMMARLAQDLQVRVRLHVLFTHPTLGEFATAVGRARRSGPPQIPRVDGTGPFPVSFSQQRIWFIAMLHPASGIYNVPLSLRMHGPLRMDVLQAALDALAERQRVLRTVFPVVHGRPYQDVRDGIRFPLRLTDLSGRADAAGLLDELVEQELSRPFDLSEGPLVRAAVFRLGHADHVLLITIHHILLDGPSAEVFLAELGALYSSARGASAAPLPELAIQYTDYSVWQRRFVSEPDVQAQLKYWHTQLAGVPVLDLPTDRPRPPLRVTGGAARTFDLDPAEARSLRELARTSGATPNTVALAFLGLLLSRYCGQTDVAVGVPVAVRAADVPDHLVGNFLNMATIRIDLSGSPSFADLVQRTGNAMIAAIENSDAPFELVVDAIGAERDTSRSPLFDVSFTYLVRTDPPGRTFHEITTTEYACTQRTAKFDLSLTLTDTGRRVYATWEYATTLFDAGSVQRFHQAYVQLLRSAASEPDRAAAELPASAATVPPPSAYGPARALPPRGAHELATEQAGRTPDAIAVESGGRVMTYAELDRESNQLARVLRDLGVGPELPVGVCLPRGTGLLVALLGIWKAGGAYVPLDPVFPPARLAYMLERTGAPLVITEGGAPAALPANRVRMVDLADEVVRAASAAPLPRAAHPENLAYIIFTSGSTGLPKGVAVTHRSLVNVLNSFAGHVRLNTADALLAVTTLSFDISVLELLLPLLAGGRVVIADEAHATDPAALAGLISSSAATIMQATPATWRFLVDGPGIPAQLKTRLCGGEQMPRELAQALGGPGVTAWNVYGPTETTVWSSAGPAPEPGQLPLLGSPVDNTALYILDANLDPVPDGVAGEIFIGGAGVARGYYRAAAATATRFLPDPYAPAAGQRMYRTGDLARRRNDTAGIEFLGRVDQQVKVRGHRIEPAEIEMALATHPAIRQAAVTLHQDRAEEPRLVAYLVPSGAAGVPDAGQMRAHLRQSLPEYMVPTDFAVLGSLPLTPNRKVDRAALPQVSSQQVPAGGAFTPPRHQAERTLADIWADVLGLDDVGIDDNFFELGGDSISGIQVVVRAKAVGMWVEVAQIFECQTIRKLARRASDNTPRPSVGPRTGRLRWVPPQGEQPGAAVYLARMLLPPLPEPLAAEATGRVLARHDMLRARRLPGGGIIIPPAAPDPVIDVPTVRADRPAGERIQAGLVAEVRSGPDLTRTSIVRRPDGSGMFMLAAHETVLDHGSWQVLTRDLETAWAAARAGAPAPEPEPTTSYKHWSDRLHEYAESGVLRRDASYWLELADGLAQAAACHGRMLSSGAEPVAAVATEAIMNGDMARWYGAEPRELLLAAVVLTLCPAASAEPLLIHVETDGRHIPFPDLDLSRTVGRLAMDYPVRLSRGADPAATVRRVNHELQRVPKQGLPYGLAAHSAADPDLAASLRALREQGLRVTIALEPPAGTGWPDLDTADAGRPALPEVKFMLRDGRLNVEWLAPADHEQAGLLPRLRAGLTRQIADLAGTARDGRAAGRTPPSRFSLARLTQAQLSSFSGPVTDVYPLTPAQHGMLFHALYSPGEALYVNQTTIAIDGSFQLETFSQALSTVTRRHAALRSAVCWKGLSEPHQVVYDDVEPELRVVDSAAVPGFQLDHFLAEDRAAAFDLGTPPLFRVTVVRKAPRSYVMALTSHHVMLDGWSANMIMEECWHAYRELEAGRPVSTQRGPQYRDYVAWLGTQSRWEADRFWARMLDGAVPPIPSAAINSATTTVSAADEGVVRREISADVAGFCRDLRLTPAVLVYAGWAAALGREAGRPDAIFGIALSGRSAPVTGIDRIAGLCANTLPMRVRLGRQNDAEFLRRLQRLSSDLTRFEHSPLREVERFAHLPARTQLFDSIVSVQSFPVFDGAGHWTDGAVTLRRTSDAGRTNYALSVFARPEAGIRLGVRFDQTRVQPSRAEFLASEMCTAITGLVREMPRR